MPRKSLLGIDLMEWNALSGLSDPYALELAKISAEAGVPRISSLREDADTDRDPHHNLGGEEGNSKRRKRLDLLRKGNKPDVSPGLTKFLRKQGSMKVDDISYEGCLNAYLEDYGSSLDEFNYLLDYAVENGDVDLQDDLLAIEETFDYILEDFAQMNKKANDIKAKQQAAAGTAPPTPTVKPVGPPAPTGFKANLKARQAKGVAAGYAASQKAKVPAGAPAPTAAPAAAASPPPAEAPTPGTAGGTPPPPPTAGAPAPGAAPAQPAASTEPGKAGAKTPAVGTTGGNTDQTAPAAPTQPGQTRKTKDPKEPTQKSALGRLAQGAVNTIAGGVQGGRLAGRGIKKAVGKVKKGMQDQPNESVEYWEEFLDENGLTVDEYMMVVEDAYEYDDEEMIDHVHQLEGKYADWKAAKAARAKAKSDETSAKMKGKWKAATDVINKHGKQAVRDASNRGIDLPKRVATGGGTSANETMDWMLQMSGYTDEYITEGRGHRSDKPFDTVVQHRKTGGAGAYRLRSLEKAFKDIKAKHAGKAKKSGSTNEAMTKMLQMSGYTDEYVEARTKEQQYHGMIKQTADDDSGEHSSERSKANDDRYDKRSGKRLARKSAEQDRGYKPTEYGRKKLRSLKPDHEPAYGDRVADDRKYLKGRNQDKLAAKAAKSPRERRSDIRRKARGHS